MFYLDFCCFLGRYGDRLLGSLLLEYFFLFEYITWNWGTLLFLLEYIFLLAFFVFWWLLLKVLFGYDDLWLGMNRILFFDFLGEGLLLLLLLYNLFFI